MIRMTTYLTRTTLVIGLITTPFAVLADIDGEHFAHTAAMLRAGAETCDAYSASELNDLRDHQRSTIADLGVSPDEFDRLFDVSYPKAQGILTTLSPAEIAEICEELEETPIS